MNYRRLSLILIALVPLAGLVIWLTWPSPQTVQIPPLPAPQKTQTEVGNTTVEDRPSPAPELTAIDLPHGTLIRNLVAQVGRRQPLEKEFQSIRFTPPGTRDAVEARQRTLQKGNGFEIRETLFGEVRVARIVEQIADPGTPQQRINAREEMAAHEVIVRAGANAQEGSELLTANDFTVLRKLNSDAVLVATNDGESVEELLVRLRSIKRAYAEPNWIVRASGTPNDPSFAQMWALNNTGQTSGTPDADIDAPEAWDVHTGSSSMIVAVIDTGIDYTHPDLAPNMWTNSGETGEDGSGRDKRTNGIDDDANGIIDDVYGANYVNDNGDPKDDNFHGTHCAGTIGSRGNNGVGVSGVCWNVSLMALKFLNSAGAGYTSDALLAVDYARLHGAKVMSNSWGGGGYSQSLYEAISNANTQGILFTAAAGNEGANNDMIATYPAGFDLPNIISVLATDHTDTVAGFSNYGATRVDIAAPGVNILSTFPTYMTSYMTSYGYSTNYGAISGTSMATPHVSGAAALLWANEPGLSVTQVKERLLISSDRKTALTGSCVTGGRLNVNNALRNIVSPLQLAAINVPLEYGYSGKSIEILGTAFATNLTNYTIEVGAGATPSTWNSVGVTLVNGGMLGVQDGKLADWLSGVTTPGVWSIRLTVNSSNGSKSYIRHVNIDPALKTGFPVYAGYVGGSYNGGANSLGITIASLDGNGKQDVIASPTAGGPLTAWDYLGRIKSGWPTSTIGVGYAAAADVNRDGKAEVALVVNQNFGAWGILDRNAKFLPGFPFTAQNYNASAPTFADIDGDGRPEMLTNQQNRDLTVVQPDGSSLPGWNKTNLESQSILSPVVGDVDGDGFNEVFAFSAGSSAGSTVYGWRADGTTLSGWPVVLPSYTGTGLALGDLDGDGILEIVLVAQYQSNVTPGKIFCFKPDGTAKTGWPFTPNLTGVQFSPPALGDINGDGKPEVIVAFDASNSAAGVYVLNASGVPVSGWPKLSTGSWISFFAPVVGDIDGDGTADIFMAFRDTSSWGIQMAWKGNGTVISGFPKNLELGFGGTPSIADLDGDGRNELLVYSDNWSGYNIYQPCVFAWDFNAPGTTSGPVEWGQMRGDSGHTGLYWRNRSNLRPSAKDKTVVVNINSSANPVLLDVADDQNAPLSFSLLTSPSVGTLGGNAPNLSYTPPVGYRGKVDFTFKVNDGVWDSRIATVTIYVDARPTAPNMQITTPEDTPITFTPAVSDADGDALTITIVRAPVYYYGSVTVSGTALTLTPALNMNGTFTFTYKVSDGLLESPEATVTVVLTPVNDAPVANDSVLYVPKDTTYPTTVYLYAVDLDQEALTYTLISTPTHGVLTGTAPFMSYVPNPGYYGPDTVTWKANDGKVDSNIATFTIRVNVPPQVSNISATTSEDTPVLLQLSGTDINNDPLVYQSYGLPAHGTYTATATPGQWLYTPAANYSGPDSFGYYAYDGGTSGNIATITLQITPVNDAPTPGRDVLVTSPGQAVSIASVLANDIDVDGDAISLVSVNTPANGMLSNQSATGFTYTPNAGFRTQDSFNYTVRDSNGATAQGTVTVVMLSPSSVTGTWPMMGNGNDHCSYVNVALSDDALVPGWSASLSSYALKQVAINDGVVAALVRPDSSLGLSLIGLEATTGIEIWRSAQGMSYGYYSPPTIVNGKVFAQTTQTTGNGQLAALNAATGATLWMNTYPSQFSSYMSPAADATNVYIPGGTTIGMYGYGQVTGAQKFFVPIESYDNWAPALYGGRLFSWVRNTLREHDSANGTVLWSTSLPSNYSGGVNSVPALAQGRAFVIDSNSGFAYPAVQLHAIDLASHEEVWNVTGNFVGSPAYFNNVVYAINNDRVDAYNALNGQLLRSYPGESPFTWQPIVTDNTLFIASAGRTSVFDLTTGTLRQTLPFGGRLSLAGNRLYIATDSGLLQTYTFLKPNQPPAFSSVWATPNPVQLPNTVSITANASDAENDPLNYTFSKVDGPGTVVFTPKTSTQGMSTASFSAAGIYTLQVAVSDGRTTANTTFVVQVLQPTPVLTSILVTPALATMNVGGTQQFSAVGYDQYGAVFPGLTFAWTATGGVVSPTGLFTAGLNAGSFTVTASASGYSKTAAITISNPYDAGLATEFFDWATTVSVVPSLAGRTADVVRTDAQINYPSTTTAWTGLGTQFADTFVTRHRGYLRVNTPGTYTLYVNSDDGSNVYLNNTLLINNDGLHGMRERSATVTLAAGYHPLRVEFFEASGGAGLQLSWAGPGIAKQIIPGTALWQDRRVVSSVSVTPAITNVIRGSNMQFVAALKDQYGWPISAVVSWSVSGGGTIDSNGLFTAQTAGTFIVTAASGSMSANAQITVTPYMPGLKAEFFDWATTLSAIPDLSGRTANVTRTDAQVNYPSTSSAWTGLGAQFADTFVSRHTGFLKIDTAGSYTLSINSDDGSKVYLDGALVINNDGLHGMQERTATLSLSPGYHALRIEFFEKNGGAGMVFSWTGPSIAKQVVPASALYQQAP